MADMGRRSDRTPIIDGAVESFADEAERGYDVVRSARRRQAGRPSEPASAIESLALDAELKRELILRAAEEQISVAEIIRRALREYVQAN
jgi:predicted HicB family RNase H-like nuclease